MKAIAETLGVSRSNLIERPPRTPRPRRPYRKPEDAVLLPLIRQLVDERPTYGYRRLTALLNRQLRAAGKPTLNGKRVRIRVRDGNVFLNKARVVTPDVMASNGVIHVINRVLIPR